MSSSVVDVKTFLDVITGGRTPQAWITAVGDIEKAVPSEWFGGRYWDYNQALTAGADANWYYALGLIAGNQRTLDKWCMGTLIALDDVGEKTGDANDIFDALGNPTFKIQTSMGSQQWGYVLEAPVTDPTVMARLQRALTLKFYPNRKDPGHERIVQYLRLPCGVNNKKKRVAENGGKPWRVVLTHWDPGQKIELMDVIDALGDAWTQTENMNISASGLPGPTTPQEAAPYKGTDLILAGMDALGRVRWEDVRNGFVGVDCPWDHMHTVRDGSEGYNPATRQFSCFHTTHGVKTADDIRQWLEGELGPKWEPLRKQVMGNVFPPLSEAEQQAIEQAAQEAVQKALGKPGKVAWRSVLINPPPGTMSARRSICRLLARGEVSYIAGAPSIGKSAMMVAYACSIAADRGDLIGEAGGIERTGPVLIISNEDTADQVQKRIAGWKAKHKYPKGVHEVYVSEVQGLMVVSKPDRYSPVELGPAMASITEAVHQYRPCLVVVDTQAASFGGIGENDNADAGRAMSLLAGWASQHDVALLIIHHGQKAQGRTGGAGDLNTLRGGGAFGGGARNAVTLTAIEGCKDNNWVEERGAKGNHTNILGQSKFWYREEERITVEDKIDAPGVGYTEQVPVYVYKAVGPVVGFDCTGDATMAAVMEVVREAEDDGEPARVRRSMARKGGGAIPNLSDMLVDRWGWKLAEADEAVEAAKDIGHIRDNLHKTEQRNTVSIWQPTPEGTAWHNDWKVKAEKTLQETADQVPNEAGELA